jgi:hypothetical protein
MDSPELQSLRAENEQLKRVVASVAGGADELLAQKKALSEVLRKIRELGDAAAAIELAAKAKAAEELFG